MIQSEVELIRLLKACTPYRQFVNIQFTFSSNKAYNIQNCGTTSPFSRGRDKSTEEMIVTFENKILETIFGPTKEDDVRRIKHNREIRNLFRARGIIEKLKNTSLM